MSLKLKASLNIKKKEHLLENPKTYINWLKTPTKHNTENTNKTMNQQYMN